MVRRHNGLSNGKRAGLWIERSGFESWPDHFVVFLGKTLYSHSASLHPRDWSINGYQQTCQGNLMGFTCDRLASHPGGVAILLVTSCYGNRDRLWQ